MSANFSYLIQLPQDFDGLCTRAMNYKASLSRSSRGVCSATCQLTRPSSERSRDAALRNKPTWGGVMVDIVGPAHLWRPSLVLSPSAGAVPVTSSSLSRQERGTAGGNNGSTFAVVPVFQKRGRFQHTGSEHWMESNARCER